MIYVGIDNGITGSIGVINNDDIRYYHMPIKKVLNYQKTSVHYIHRVDTNELKNILNSYKVFNVPLYAMIERPMVNPARFQASTSALRSLEAVLICLEDLGIGYEYIDSKSWQRALLPYMQFSKNEYSKKIKELSLQRGKQIFPMINFEGFMDADGLLIAWYNKLQKQSGQK